MSGIHHVQQTQMKDISKRKQILIVDDEAGIREILSRKLSSAGFDCRTADNGSDALKTINSWCPDIVLLDVNMPGKSGAAVLKEIGEQHPDTAVIMVTAIAEVQVVISLLKDGAYDYVIKPIELNTLLLSIERTLEKRRLIDENRQYQLHLEQKVEEQTQKIRQSFLNAITSLATALEAKDRYTHGHSKRMTDTAVAIARKMDLPEAEIKRIELAGLLHDIGKIGISEEILNKPGKLSNDEYDLVKMHPEIGERILQPIIEDPEIISMIRHHHEYYDGSGYPDGLPGSEHPSAHERNARESVNCLSLTTMILTAADAFDAMISDRPYRSAMSLEATLAELQRCKNRQFHPRVVDTFIAMLESGAVTT